MKRFSLECRTKFVFTLVLHCYAIEKKTFATTLSFIEWEIKLKSIVTRSQTDRQTDRQTDNIYLSTLIIKAMQLMGSRINTKPKNIIYA